jgi:hydroxymethylpyrimidine/phosphomethylpyrimidine kinase
VLPDAEIAATGSAFTVIAAATDAEQPFEFVTVYVKITLPALTAVTVPFELIVATEALLVDQVPPCVAEESTDVDPTQILFDPVIAATTGNGLTTTFVATDEAVHPEPFVTSTLYVPAVLAMIDCVVSPEFQ